MNGVSIHEECNQGWKVGAAIAIIPAAATFLIAASRAILIELIANAILRVLTAGQVGIHIWGLSLIEVPFLWKVSAIAAKIGGGIVVVSLVVMLANAAYHRVFPPRSRWAT